MTLTAVQIRRYFEGRLAGQRFTSAAEVKLRCPFHDDRTPSLSVNLEKGVWKCFATCGEGGLIDFEAKISRCDRETAKANIADLVGNRHLFSTSQEPEAIYEYQSDDGQLVFQKLRYPGKRFVTRRPRGKGWEYNLDGIEKPLYRLPEVVAANYVFVTEGEKDADNVRALNLSKSEKRWFVAATTNYAGAGNWRDEDSRYLIGKAVVILPDNDEPGRKHAEQVAASVYPFTKRVKIVALPNLPEKGDVSDFLKSHSVDEFLEQVKKASTWAPTTPDGPKQLVPVTRFVAEVPETINWMVEGIIERGANGVICAEPKVGKTWAAIDLAISLALGTEFMGFRIPRPVKVALYSREDNPSLTAWRIRHLFAGKQAENPGSLDTNLYINTRQQSKQLLLNNPEQMAEMLADLRVVKPEFLILDVLNVLHTANENDNTEMRQVLARLEEIQREIGCGIGIVHHFNKMGQGSLTQRMRGSSAIAGWCEWMIGISIEDEARKLRKMQFELKAAEPPEPIYWGITSGLGVATLKRIPQDVENYGTVQ